MTGQIGSIPLFKPCYIHYDSKGTSYCRSQATVDELFSSSIEKSINVNPAPHTDIRPKSIKVIFDHLSSLYNAIFSKIRSFIRLLFGRSDQEIESMKLVISNSLMKVVKEIESPQDQDKIFIHLKFGNRISLQFAYEPGSISNQNIRIIAEKFFSDQFKADPYVKNYEFSVCSLHLNYSERDLKNQVSQVWIATKCKIHHWKNSSIWIFASPRTGSLSDSSLYWLNLTSSKGKKEGMVQINQETHLNLAEEDLFEGNRVIL